MSASGSRGLLTLSTRQLMARWQETRETWRDDKAAEFETIYLVELTQSLNSTLKVIEELEKVLEKAHADCE
jgi:hypothetical protein